MDALGIRRRFVIRYAGREEGMPSQGVPNSKQLSELIGTIYDAALDGRHWCGFMRQLAAAFHARSGLLLHVEKGAAQAEFLETAGLDRGVMAKWSDSRDHTDVWWGPIHSIGVDRSIIYTNLVPPENLTKSGFYADICKPNDVHHGLAGVANLTPARETFVAVYKARRDPDFSEDQRRLYELILPHLRRALAVSRQLSLQGHAEGALTDALSHFPFGALLLDQSGYSLCVNDQADRVFLANDGLTLRSGRLRFRDYAAQRQFDRRIGQLSLSGDTGCHVSLGGTVVGQRHLGKQPYQVLLCPLNSHSDRTNFGPRASWLVFIQDPEVDRAISPDVLAQLYQLTEAEACLCTEFYRTGRLEDAASSRHISMNTAKTHLKRIFGKTGTSSQAQLIKKLALSVAAVGTTK